MAESSTSQSNTSKQADYSLEQVFIANELLPNAAEAFAESFAAIEEAIKTADIVLDTNVLLLPYGAGASSLKNVIEVFSNLGKDKRLYLPAQVAREFIKNRPNKLAELQQGLSDRISRFLALEKLSFPILEGLKEYEQLNVALQKTAELKKELSKTNSVLLQKIRSWEWNDPVHSAYRVVFTSDKIIEPKIDRQETLNELLRRKTLSIPPGYKDSTKDDLGIGDFLIWRTILAIGNANKKNMIFVSGDEKADWQHRTGGSGFLPRYELLDEYRRASAGKSFYIIPLSKLLELMQVESASVEEIKLEEERVQEANSVVVACPYCATSVQSRLADHLGASSRPRCPACERPFFIHRAHNDGVIIHQINVQESTSKGTTESRVESVACPNCECAVEAELGTYHNATSWCSCGQCNTTFPIHRKSDGSVMISKAKVVQS